MKYRGWKVATTGFGHTTVQNRKTGLTIVISGGQNISEHEDTVKRICTNLKPSLAK